jgi:hypothetical protein
VISGDLQIMLLWIGTETGLELARQVLRAHMYRRSRGPVGRHYDRVGRPCRGTPSIW